MIGSVYTWSAINPYFTSYLKYNGNPSIKQLDIFFIMPIIVFIQYALLPIGILAGDKLGAKFITGFGSLLMVLSFIFIKVYANYYFVMFSICLFGIGASLGFLYLIKNGWKYFPTRTGLVSGIILGGLGLSSTVLNPLADFMINPDKTAPDAQGFYAQAIADNFHSYLIFIIVLYLVLGAFSISLTFTFIPDKDKKPQMVNEAQAEPIEHQEPMVPEVLPETNEGQAEAIKEDNNVPDFVPSLQNQYQTPNLEGREEGEQTLHNDNINLNINPELNPAIIQMPSPEIEDNPPPITKDKPEEYATPNIGNTDAIVPSSNSQREESHRAINNYSTPRKEPSLNEIQNGPHIDHNHELNSTLHTEPTKEHLNKGDSQANESITTAMKSRRNILLYSITFIAPCKHSLIIIDLVFPILLTNTNRAFGNLNSLSQAGLQIMSFVSAILNFSTRFLWGWLIDRVKFKVLMGVVLFLELAISLSVYFAAENLIGYVVVNVFIGSCIAGIFTTFPPTFNRMFGTQNGAKIFSYSGVLIGLSSLLGPILTKVVIKDKNDYLIVYLTSSGMIVIAIVILFIWNETPFDYQPQSSNEKQNLPNKNIEVDPLINLAPKQEDKGLATEAIEEEPSCNHNIGPIANNANANSATNQIALRINN